MNKNNIVIRLVEKNEYRIVENLVRESFWNVYRPGCYEHFVLNKLRTSPEYISDLDFVLLKDGEIIGQNIFVRANIFSDNNDVIPILTMGPICIHPDYKRKGYGKILLDFSLDKAKEYGFGAVCFEGNIQFYGHSGFTFASRFGIRYHGLNEDEDSSFFLCKELIPGYLDSISGEYATPECYFACDEFPEEFVEFDSTFPEKVKLKLPGQLF